MSRDTNLLELLSFLRSREDSGESFEIQDVTDFTSYKKSTITTYFGKYLAGYLVYRQTDETYISQGIQSLTDEDFLDHMSQRKVVCISSQERFRLGLVRRSLQAFMLALEIYNRPRLSNRVEGFTIFVINAWELLLKAELFKNSGRAAIFYQAPNDSRSLSLRDVLKKRMKENDPVRHNIETLEEIRDDAIHLFIPRILPEFSRLFQATVLNYCARYRKENKRHPLAGQNTGLLSLVVDEPSPEIMQLKHEYGTETAERIKQFLDKFRTLESEFESSEFAVSVEYKLVLTKKEIESDVVLSSGDAGKDTAIIVEKPKDVKTQYPYSELVLGKH